MLRAARGRPSQVAASHRATDLRPAVAPPTQRTRTRTCNSASGWLLDELEVAVQLQTTTASRHNGATGRQPGRALTCPGIADRPRILGSGADSWSAATRKDPGKDRFVAAGAAAAPGLARPPVVMHMVGACCLWYGC